MATAASVNLVAPNREFINEDGLFTFNLAAGMTIADIGYAVTLDPTAYLQVKLAGVGDPIFGRLEVFEQRSQTGQLIGTVATEFMGRLPLAAGQTPAVGDFLVGGGNGTVQKYVAPGAYAPSNPVGLVQCIYTGDEAAGYVSVLKS